ncbi:MAG TPA: hypothetical protein VF185_03245 [Patescibacteria group bacterium]
MKNFDQIIGKTGEVGFVEEIVHSLVFVSGLPSAHINEIVVFEEGGMGQILSVTDTYVEIILLTRDGENEGQIKVGTKVARTGYDFNIALDDSLLGKIVHSLDLASDSGSSVHAEPSNILNRNVIDEPLYTGLSLVDLVVPLGKGQRELVIGDRKTGKTDFLLQTMLTQSKLGTICIYAGVGKKDVETKKVEEFVKSHGMEKTTIIISSRASDLAGVIFVTPYVAMTVAEYWQKKGKDVLLVLDDLTNHAKAYREITLLAKRFPGRSSYPGDIFYIHSKLVERAGKFKTGSITCLPVAESVLGDLSGYIQTNLMAMTDGHIFFDTDLANLGRRPAVNPFLSVTRVGYQAQSPLVRDLSRELNSFLIKIDNLRQLMHFGAELNESIRQTLDLGDRTFAFFDQATGISTPINVSVIILAALWSGFWKDVDYVRMRVEMSKLAEVYLKDAAFKKEIDTRVESSPTLSLLMDNLKKDNAFLVKYVRGVNG